MGRTVSLFPGIVNVDDDEGDSSAAAAVGEATFPRSEEPVVLVSLEAPVVSVAPVAPVASVVSLPPSAVVELVVVGVSARPDAGVGTV
jgi:hypothetical protein